jgi:ABC-type multidrug transport system fused ATPase/permease subunit
MLLGVSYPLLDAFLTILEIFLFIVWIWLLISVFGDIFRSHDLSGVAKAIWVLVVVIFPYLGVFVYLIARGGKMHERSIRAAQAQREAFDSYVRETATAASPGEELAKLADLRDRGVLSEAEFNQQKAKILAK